MKREMKQKRNGEKIFFNASNGNEKRDLLFHSLRTVTKFREQKRGCKKREIDEQRGRK